MEGFRMTFQGKKVLVTGGAGFVGSNLVDQLVREGADVIVLDDLFTGKKENIQLIDDVEFIQGSVVDWPLVCNLVKRSDLVFHLAARNIIVSTKNPKLDFEVNARGTLTIAPQLIHRLSTPMDPSYATVMSPLKVLHNSLHWFGFAR